MADAHATFEEHLTGLVIAINEMDSPAASSILVHMITDHPEEFVRFAELAEHTYHQVIEQLSEILSRQEEI